MDGSAAPRRPFADAAAIALVVAAVLAVVVAFCVVVVKAQAIVFAFFGAIVLAEAVRPIVDGLSKRAPRTLSLAVTFAAVAAAIAFVWAIPVRALAPQVMQFWRTLPCYLTEVLAAIDRSTGGPPAGPLALPVQSLGGFIVPFVQGLLGAEASLAGFLSTVVLVLLMALFWLVSSDALRAFVVTLVAPDQRDAAVNLFDELGTKLGRYVSGTLINGTIVGTGSSVLLWAIGAPYAIVLGLLQGLLVAIPYLGTLVAVLTIGGVVFAAQGWVRAAEAIVLVSILEGLEGSFVSPPIFKQRVDVAPLSTILATAIGGALFGINGVVLAVPAAAVLHTLTVRLLAPTIRSFSTR